MDPVSDRLRRRIEHDFPQADTARLVEALVAEAGSSERVQAAIVLSASGDLDSVGRAHDLALLDWRDVLMNAGLGHEGWRIKLDAELGAEP